MLRDRLSFAHAAWDWSCFDECFSGAVRMSDIDGVVEANGHVLFVEAKPAYEPGLSVGQLRLFRTLSELPRVTVLVLFGTDGAPERWYRFHGEGMRHTTIDEVRRFIAAWYDRARASR